MLSAEILVAAFVADGKHASGFPMFGFERRGAPVAAFVRVNDQAILQSLEHYFKGKLLSINRKSVERGFHELAVKEYR